jgi:hypothetical protein
MRTTQLFPFLCPKLTHTANRVTSIIHISKGHRAGQGDNVVNDPESDWRKTGNLRLQYVAALLCALQKMES